MTNKYLVLGYLMQDDETFTQIVEFFKFIKVNISEIKIQALLDKLLKDGYIAVNQSWQTELLEYPYTITAKGRKEYDVKYNHGNAIINNAYNKFFLGEKLSYEEFVILANAVDELCFTYCEIQYKFLHTPKQTVDICIIRIENGSNVLEGREEFISIIDALLNFRINGKTIHEIWPEVIFDRHAL